MSLNSIVRRGYDSMSPDAIARRGYASHTGLPQPPITGYQYEACTTAPYTGSGDSLEQGSSPLVVVGDVFIAQLLTSPNSFAVQLNGDGTLEVIAGGNTSRQKLLYGVYRVTGNAIDPVGFPASTAIVWINEVAPYWNAGVISPVNIQFPTVGVAITPITLQSSTFAVSPPGDTLTFAVASGALPTGLSIISGQIVGTPTTVGAFTFTLSATDITGMSTVSPASSITVSSPTIQVMPNVIGLTLIQASVQLTALGFTTIIVLGTGTVITGQLPVAGGTVSTLSQVTLYLGALISVPNFIGLEYLAALALLKASNLTTTAPIEKVIRQGGSSQLGYVIGQTLPAGTIVIVGTQVILTVNKPYGQFPATDQNEPIPYWYFLTK